MRFHCLGGAGSIGALISTNLARLPNTKVRLILRSKPTVANLLARSDSPKTSTGTGPHLSLSIEQDGLSRRTDNLEVELLPTPSLSLHDLRPPIPSSRTLHKPGDPRSSHYGDLVRNDPIDTLFITTKAPQTLPALGPLLPRLSSRSTVVLCQNGMGVLEGLLEKYWPDDLSSLEGAQWGARPSFICATTTHGVWRKSDTTFVHAGVGDLKFGVVPNQAVQREIKASSSTAVESNPLLNPRSFTPPSLSHLPLTATTHSLHTTLSSLLQLGDLNPSWLPLRTLQIVQLQKLAVNASVNSLTALLGVQNGAMVGSAKAKALIRTVASECESVFAAHLAREEGTWVPPPLPAFIPVDSFSSDEDDVSEDYAGRRPAGKRSPRRREAVSPHPPPPPRLPRSHPLSADSLSTYTLQVAFKTAHNLSSTLSDILAVSPSSTPMTSSRTEMDYINGYIAALGSRYGIPTPLTTGLGEMVKLKEELLGAGAVDTVVERRIERVSASSALEAREGKGRRERKYERAQDQEVSRLRRRSSVERTMTEKRREAAGA